MNETLCRCCGKPMEAALQERFNKPALVLLTCRTPGCVCATYTVSAGNYAQLTTCEWVAYPRMGWPARLSGGAL